MLFRSIIGKLIPAGTGSLADRPMNHIVKEKADELRAKREERNRKEEEDDILSFVNDRNDIPGFIRVEDLPPIIDDPEDEFLFRDDL